jgi:osmotically-inducible protein OsmY
VSERLERHGHIDASDIEVTVENGEVTLQGTVDSRRSKRLAEDVAESVYGVKDVHNQLRIQETTSEAVAAARSVDEL